MDRNCLQTSIFANREWPQSGGMIVLTPSTSDGPGFVVWIEPGFGDSESAGIRVVVGRSTWNIGDGVLDAPVWG
jgi:hypothetical protein